MRKFSSFSEVIDAFATNEPIRTGPSVVAEIIKKEESHVRTMKARDSIPPEYWGALIDEASRRGIQGLTHRVFLDLRAARFAPEQRGAA